MKNPANSFKRALAAGELQVGMWVGLADGYATELLATIGFDWLLVDGEHAPNDLRSVLAQLQSAAPYATHPVVRPPEGSTVLVKQYLDIGAQTLLVPMVETAGQAAAVVAATRYPPHGVRGVGSALARSSRWNQVDGYLQDASDEICVLVQVESASALRQVAEIAAVDGIDGVFFGPADLSASMGLLGQPGHPDVQQAIRDGIATARGAGKAAGVLSADPKLARLYIEAGATFVAVAVDTTLLVHAAKAVCSSFKSTSAAPAAPSGAY
ncbi:4-hydroxy-2-oxoheptanedioate aldolase [Ramlibacter algicola]|uniref:4-hydroxy-2-oxoheptanedioate aldolase n=1 Tax=Ramlibacter algicola TaxID=2795217 RepID=A0A934Q174_9BURK|nr:4-hydroxy-2-oxoheptanedioate aldolase [Ramlibacter algicola]MBK0392616.1 4-hydroxy-2-oxoheptanedioate aldolase [Ramlibacter algicola]